LHKRFEKSLREAIHRVVEAVVEAMHKDRNLVAPAFFGGGDDGGVEPDLSRYLVASVTKSRRGSPGSALGH
jgi:hypothetical protein